MQAAPLQNCPGGRHGYRSGPGHTSRLPAGTAPVSTTAGSSTTITAGRRRCPSSSGFWRKDRGGWKTTSTPAATAPTVIRSWAMIRRPWPRCCAPSPMTGPGQSSVVLDRRGIRLAGRGQLVKGLRSFPVSQVAVADTQLNTREVAVTVRGDKTAPAVVTGTGQGQGIPVGCLPVPLTSWPRPASRIPRRSNTTEQSFSPCQRRQAECPCLTNF